MVVDGERRAPRRKAAAVASVDHKEVTTADFDRALDRYLEEMSRPSTFGDHAAMVAFTQCYSTDIRVFFKSSDYYVNVVEGSVSRKVAYIAYHVSGIEVTLLPQPTNSHFRMTFSITTQFGKSVDLTLVYQRLGRILLPPLPHQPT